MLVYIDASVFFNHLYFQKVEIDLFDEGILGESAFGVPAKIFDGGIEPEGHTEIKGNANLFQTGEDFAGSIERRIFIADDEILYKMIASEYLSP